MEDKIFYHILLKIKDGTLMFRCPEDYYYFINILATSGQTFKINIVAYSCLPEHVHIGILSEKDPKAFIRKICHRYTKYFTRRYDQKGSILSKPVYYAKIIDPNCIKIALSLILKNSEMHRFSNTVFDYKFSSSGYYFEKELGKKPDQRFTFHVNALVSKNFPVPKGWNVLKSGLIDPHNWLDIKSAEEYFNGYADFLKFAVVKCVGILKRTYQLKEVESEYFPRELFCKYLAREFPNGCA